MQAPKTPLRALLSFSNTPSARWPIVALSVVVLLATACGGGNDDQPPSLSSPATPAAIGVAYGEQLTAIDEAIDEQIEIVSSEFTGIVDEFLESLVGMLDTAGLQEQIEEGFAVVFSAALDFVPRAIAVIEDGVERIEVLDTPSRFEADERAYLDAIDRRLDLLRVLEEVADQEDVEAFFALDPVMALDDVDVMLRAAVSDEFRVLIAAYLDDGGGL
jgi:hypothetical protein